MSSENTTKISAQLFKMLAASDALWQHRKRKITTSSVFAALCDSFAKKRGLNHVIQSDQTFTPQALSVARSKLPGGLFARINRALVRKNVVGGPRVYVVDGSKVHIPPSFRAFGYKTRTNDKPVPRPARRTMLMLSSCLDVRSRVCLDSQLSAHFNERTSALEHLKAVRPGDTLLFDRGYYSHNLFESACASGVRTVFRLKRDAFRGVSTFYNSNRNHAHTVVAGRRAWLLKYRIDGKIYVCLTNFECTPGEVRDLYALRWRVETSFRRLKSDLHLEQCHSRTPTGYVQEVEARILLDTLSVLTSRPEASPPTYRPVSYFRSLDAVISTVNVIKVCSELHLDNQQFLRLLRASRDDAG
jgi:hypothetical protein